MYWELAGLELSQEQLAGVPSDGIKTTILFLFHMLSSLSGYTWSGSNHSRPWTSGFKFSGKNLVQVHEKSKSLFLRSPSKRFMVKQWLWLGHMPIPEPITVARGMVWMDLFEPGAHFWAGVHPHPWNEGGEGDDPHKSGAADKWVRNAIKQPNEDMTSWADSEGQMKFLMKCVLTRLVPNKCWFPHFLALKFAAFLSGSVRLETQAPPFPIQ